MSAPTAASEAKAAASSDGVLHVLVDLKLVNSEAATVTAFVALMNEYVATARANETKTLIRMAFVADKKDPTRYMLIEEFKGEAGAAARTESAYHKAFLPKLKGNRSAAQQSDMKKSRGGRKTVAAGGDGKTDENGADGGA